MTRWLVIGLENERGAWETYENNEYKLWKSRSPTAVEEDVGSMNELECSWDGVLAGVFMLSCQLVTNVRLASPIAIV